VNNKKTRGETKKKIMGRIIGGNINSGSSDRTNMLLEVEDLVSRKAAIGVKDLVEKVIDLLLALR